jgi:hypothetical protein
MVTLATSNDSLSTDSDSFVEVRDNLNFTVKVVLNSASDAPGEYGASSTKRRRTCSFYFPEYSVLCHSRRFPITAATAATETRRFRLRQLVDDKSETISLKRLVQLLKEAYGAAKDWAPTFFYADSDGDEIAVTTTCELLDAVSQFADASTLKLVVKTPTIGSQMDGSLTLITDVSATERILHLMSERTLDPVPYKNNLIDASNKAILTHLMDEFKDHFTATYSPSLYHVNEGNNSYRACFQYNISGEKVRSKYLAIDGVYLDLTKKSIVDGFVAVLFPRPIFNKWKALILCNTSTQFHPQDCVATTETEELQLVKVLVDKGNPPAFVSFQEQLDKGGRATGAVAAKNEGLLTDIMESENYGHLYKVTGVFTVQKTFGHNTQKHDLRLTLIGLRVFSTHDDILDKDNVVNATAFAG